MKRLLSAIVVFGLTHASVAQTSGGEAASAPVTACSSCKAWNAPRTPFRIFGNSYYVGTSGLSAILVTSPEGHVLIDGGLRESAAQIAANVQALGFRLRDIRLILNSHAHFDHAGGLAELQRATGATVAASKASAVVLKAGIAGRDDPQHDELLAFPYPPVRNVRVIADGATQRVGPLALTPHFTPGHSPGGTTWAWTSCEDGKCLNMVYADSLTPVAEPGYRFSRSARYPGVLSDFEKSYRVIETLACDVLLTPHPESSDLFNRAAARQGGTSDPLVNGGACVTYAAAARERLAQRLASEK